MDIEVDSICLVIYNGIHPIKYLPPLPFPPESEGYLESLKRIESYKIRHDSLIGEIDTTFEMSNFSQFVIDKFGKYNPSIIWESMRTYKSEELRELESILKTNNYAKTEIIELEAPAMCFDPKHSVILYKDGKVKKHYDICFHCSRVKLNSTTYIDRIDYKSLRRLVRQLGFPIFDKEEDESFADYKRRMEGKE